MTKQASQPSAPAEDAPYVRAAGLLDFNRRRKAGSREKLLDAAAATFGARGYFPVSVEDISAAAGVSRMTFYRHFSAKAELVAALFRQNSSASAPSYLAIGQRDYTSRAIVMTWIADLFSADRAQQHLLRVFIQANVDDQSVTAAGHSFIDGLIVKLGDDIPAFAVTKTDEAQRRRYLEAWLLLYEILDQSNHAARDSGVATDPLVIEILADRFLAFVGGS